jgi:small subunit ribosomal protein S1
MVVDIGAKRAGIIPPHDLQLVDEGYLSSLEVGDTVPVAVMRRRFQQNGIPVSLNRGLQKQDWLRAEELRETGEAVEAVATEANRGGLVVRFGEIRGFVPNSHLGTLVPRRGSDRFDEAKEGLVGKTLKLLVIEVTQRRRRLVLSRRAIDRRRRQQLFSELEPGQVRTGTVRSIVDYGAFVDLGGIDGLLHVSELSWARVRHPREALQVGDALQVYVKGVDRERQRISLSRKVLLPAPWDAATANLHPGDIVTGTVTTIVDFGVFVDIGHGVEGLIHNSELGLSAESRAEIQPGVGLPVRVLRIDAEKRRIGLAPVERTEADDTQGSETCEAQETERTLA